MLAPSRRSTLWLLKQIVMENGPFIDGLPIKKWWFSMAMLNNQRVNTSSPRTYHEQKKPGVYQNIPSAYFT